ncbi:MAG TPA: ATP-binding protein [Vicinamibacterales bacterium]|nr:ATP-binding protein [Vicinamibacterales bacterium]
MTDERPAPSFDRDRIRVLLEKLERLAAGDTETTLAISTVHDELDAIAFGINVLADELRWAHARITASEREKAEELRGALAHLGRVSMLDALTGSLAHDVNQPLTAAATNAVAALHLLGADPPRLRELRGALNDIVSETKRAGDIVQRMRALLKRGSTLFEPIELNTTVSDAVKLIHANAVGRRIVLDVELAAGIEPVLGDRVQIQQVVLNLLMNAFDAVQEREPADRRVELRTAPRDLAAAVEVSDQGLGLSDDALAALFEPFRTTKRDGLGLGLWICRGIVSAHGGTLSATRNPGAGMTFSARFPCWQAVAPEGLGAAGQLQEQR